MDLQYISYSEGRHTAVLIPIWEWNNLPTKYQDLKNLEKPKQKLSEKYKGVISKEQGQNLNEHIKQMRSTVEFFDKTRRMMN